MKRTLIAGAMALAVAGLGGCASPEPRYYSLAAGTPAATPSPASPSSPSTAAAQPVWIEVAPVRVPEGQLWVMGDNRNNSADARVHGPIGVTDVIGKARVIVLPVGRWGGVPDTDPQARPSALGAPVWTSGAPLAAGVLGAVPLVVVTRRVRRRWTSQGGWSASGSPPSPDPGR